MEELIIGCDIDGTAVDMSSFYIREGKKFFKKEPVDINAYSPKEMYGVSKIKEFQFGLAVFNRYCIFEPPMQDSVHVNNMSVEKGDEWHAITARKFTTSKTILGTIYRNLFEKWVIKFNFKFKSIQYCSEEFSPRDKLLACKKLNVDVMLEDKPEVALYLAKNGIKVLLVNAPYNKECNHTNIVRVQNWKEIERQLDIIRMSKQKVPEFNRLSREEKLKLNSNERRQYIQSYRKYIKNLEINQEQLKKSKNRFRLLYNLTNVAFSIIFRVEIKGKENIPYQDGFIIASNHLNSYDQFYISRALGNRQFCGFAASTIKNTLRGMMIKFTRGGVFIERGNRESTEQGEEELIIKIVNGLLAIIFSEGTRKNKDEEGRKKIQLPFKKGTASMAQKIGTGILPASLYYGNKKYLKFGEFQYVNPEDDLTEATKKLEEAVLKMTKESMEEDELNKRKRLIKK